MKQSLMIVVLVAVMITGLLSPVRAQSVSDSDFLWMDPTYIGLPCPQVDTVFQWAIMIHTATPLTSIAIPLTFTGESQLRIDTSVITPPDIVGVTYGSAGSDPAWNIRSSVVDNQAKTILLGFISFGVYPPRPMDTLCVLHIDLDATGGFVVFLDTTVIGSNHMTVTGTDAVEWVPTWTRGIVSNGFDGLENGAENAAPAEVSSFRSVPNPFNSSTRFEFTLEESDHVTLAIVNVLGEEIRRLVDRTLPLGRQRVVWDGLGPDGHSAASGIYFARLTLGSGETETRALTLLR